jgi:GH24 family phage-related lysozyme (muramidase)
VNHRALIALLATALPLAAAPVPDASVLAVLRMSEGYRLEPYHDTVLGPWTVGIGHSLDAHGQPVKARYTDAEVQAFARADLAEARAACRRGIAAFDQLPHAVQVVALSVAFGTGATGFQRFVRMRGALSARDYARAARELETSRWSNQVSRSRRDWAVKILRSYTPAATRR